MIKHIWTVLCRQSIIDKNSNNISLLNVSEKLNVNFSLKKGQQRIDKEIMIPAQHELVSFWVRDVAEKEEFITTLIEIIDPEKKILGKFEKKLIFAKNIKRVRARAQFARLKISKNGVYYFVVKFKANKDQNWKVVTQVPLEIEITKTYAGKRKVLQA